MTSKALPPFERRLLNYKAAGTYLGISERAMKDLGGPDGKILRVELGHRVLFDKVDLDAFIENLKRSA